MKKSCVRKLISVFLIVAIIAACSGFSSAFFNGTRQVLHLSDGVDALSTQFKSGVGPEAGGYALDYKYYQPTIGSGSYPLVIWLHGMGHGSYPGSQIEDNDISKWSSYEYQSRFSDSEGAYILCPRAPEDEGVYWWPDDLTKSLKALIDDFVANHTDVDTSRIYIGGFSLGGNMTVQMCLAYPSYFAAAFPICPALGFDYDLSSIENLPMWIVACRSDPMVPYRAVVCSFWKNLASTSNVASSCRFSTLTSVRCSNGSYADSNHQVWNAVTADMFTDSGDSYYNMSTVNGNGRKVTLTYPNGMIAWLSSFSK